jgi:hypothetical protein
MAAPSIRLEPPCGAARVRVIWDAEGRAPVRVLAAGTAMTGDEAAAGFAETGDWVTEGMEFKLVDGAGAVLASTVARCTAAGSIWPLQVGNEWHFRARDRASTGHHTAWRVTRTDGEWAVLDPGPSWGRRLRVDDAGRIWRQLPDGRAEVFVDPSGGPAFVRVTGSNDTSITLAGQFGRELSWGGPVVGLGRDSGKFAQGIGPVFAQSDGVAGSSGGLGSALELLEARIGGVRFGPVYPYAELVVESAAFDVTNKKARNCAVPCYFVACGLAPGADPPGAYKPCMEASLRGGSGRVQLKDSAGTVLSDTPANGWVRVLLPLTPGAYTLVGVLPSVIVTTAIEVR